MAGRELCETHGTSANRNRNEDEERKENGEKTEQEFDNTFPHVLFVP